MAFPPRTSLEADYQAGDPPWEIGRPQAELVKLLEAGELVGDVIDVGCGTGENALCVAAAGRRRVLGVDAAPTAIARAREKARARGVAAVFQVADALDLGKLRLRFETAIDCGLFHLLDRGERRQYAHSLTEVLSSGSTLHVICFSDEAPEGSVPFRVSEYELGDAFRSIFALTRVRAGVFERRDLPPAPAWVATLVKI
jgi:SAM-dependent methyltransferase